MNPYVFAIIVVLVGVLFIALIFFTPQTLYQHNPTKGEDPLLNKDLWKKWSHWNKTRHRIGCASLIVLPLIAFGVAFGWINVPVVMAALQPTATPTLTSSPTVTPSPYVTRTAGPSPAHTWTAEPISDGTHGPPTMIPTPTAKVIVQSVVQTRIVIQTKVIYQQRVITATPGATQTPWIIYVPVTETPTMITLTPTETPTASETPTQTETATP